jgi:glutathione S-transferase
MTTSDEPPAHLQPGLLYGLRGSGPTYGTELMLRHKGIPYRRVDLFAGKHRRALRRKGFPGPTVPALELAGRLAQPNRAIARLLEEVVPDPPLLPADPVARAGVEEAERFGDEVFQPAARRMVIWSFGREPKSATAHPAIGRIQIRRNAVLRVLVARQAFRLWSVTDEAVRADFQALPEMLATIDGYIAAGVLHGPDLFSADFQIAPLIAGLMGITGLNDQIAGRPAAALAGRVMAA